MTTVTATTTTPTTSFHQDSSANQSIKLEKRNGRNLFLPNQPLATILIDFWRLSTLSKITPLGLIELCHFRTVGLVTKTLLYLSYHTRLTLGNTWAELGLKDTCCVF